MLEAAIKRLENTNDERYARQEARFSDLLKRTELLEQQLKDRVIGN